jgi:hypothetical protein
MNDDEAKTIWKKGICLERLAETTENLSEERGVPAEIRS